MMHVMTLIAPYLGVYVLGTIITTIIAANHFRTGLVHESNGKREDAWVSMYGVIIAWPLVAVLGIPIFLISLVYKGAFRLGMNGSPLRSIKR